jgi:ribosomal subunit interface protein
MKTQVSILHHDYPARVRETVEEKLQHLLKFYERVVSIRALLERQNEHHRVEIVANVGRGTVLVADLTADSFSTALDGAVDRMVRHLKRHHDKVTRDRHRGGRVGH